MTETSFASRIGPVAERAVQPRVKARAGNLQNRAHPADWPDMAMLSYEGEPHVASLAKNAAAFFRMSRHSQGKQSTGLFSCPAHTLSLATSFFRAAISAIWHAAGHCLETPLRVPPLPHESNAAAHSRQYPDPEMLAPQQRLDWTCRVFVPLQVLV
jgi:hypothetical protein